MNDYKTSRDRLPKYKDDDNVGVTFSVILGITALIVGASLTAIVMHFSGLTDAFTHSFA